MADDSFIHEVNEEIRQERMRALWGRYGPIALGITLFLIAVTGIYQIYSSWQAGKADRMGEMLVQAISLKEKGDFQKSFQLLEQLKAEGSYIYPILASMEEANLKQKQGDFRGAVNIFDQIADDARTPKELQSVALLRAVYILIDVGTLEEVKSRVEKLKGTTMEASGLEALGLTEWKAGLLENAKATFTEVLAKGSSIQLATRARMMLELINNKIGFPKEVAAPVSHADPSKIIREKAAVPAQNTTKLEGTPKQ